MKQGIIFSALLLVCLLALTGCTSQVAEGRPAAEPAASPRREFTLLTGMAEGRMVYVGVGGAIDGVVNPDLVVRAGDTVHIDLLNGEGIAHDLALPDLYVQTALATSKGKATGVTFKAGKSDVYAYLCTVSGHRQAGMEGWLSWSRKNRWLASSS